MQEWWMSLDLFMKCLWCISIFSSLVFIIQSIMTFTGMDSGTDMDVDMNVDPGAMNHTDSQPFQLFTFRNFINFFLGFSWTAIALRPLVSNTVLLLVIAVIVGVALVTAVMLIFKWMSGMEQSGNIGTQQAVGCRGSVYLTIPGNREGEGKVQISIQESIREYDAMTDGEKLTNGTPVKVTAVLNDRTLLVEKI